MGAAFSLLAGRKVRSPQGGRNISDSRKLRYRSRIFRAVFLELENTIALAIAPRRLRAGPKETATCFGAPCAIPFRYLPRSNLFHSPHFGCRPFTTRETRSLPKTDQAFLQQGSRTFVRACTKVLPHSGAPAVIRPFGRKSRPGRQLPQISCKGGRHRVRRKSLKVFRH